SPPGPVLPMKLVGGRAALLKVNESALAAAGEASVSAPPVPRYHGVAVVPGSGHEANDCSKPGYGAPGVPLPAPLSNSMRTGAVASKAALASAYLPRPCSGS